MRLLRVFSLDSRQSTGAQRYRGGRGGGGGGITPKSGDCLATLRIRKSKEIQMETMIQGGLLLLVAVRWAERLARLR